MSPVVQFRNPRAHFIFGSPCTCIRQRSMHESSDEPTVPNPCCQADCGGITSLSFLVKGLAKQKICCHMYKGLACFTGAILPETKCFPFTTGGKKNRIG